MELTKEHRNQLLYDLEETNKKLERSERLLKQYEGKPLQPNFEIDVFLLRKKVELIEQSISDNEIDF